MDVLAVAAHPDDIEIGVGGTVAKHLQKGDEVTAAVLTSGGAGEADPATRETEAEHAASILGVDSITFLGFEDTALQCDHDLISAIEDVVRDSDPTRVYVHSTEDSHQDHVNAAKASLAATRDCKQVMAFESPSTLPTFSPDHFVSLSRSLLRSKCDAIGAHESQSDKSYIDTELFRSLARFRGHQSNARYAEAHEIIRFVE